MHVITRDLETKRYKFIAGLPVPPRLDTPSGRKFLRNTYGADILLEIDSRNPAEYLKLIGANSETDVKEKFAQLKLLTDQQAKRIRDLEHENEQQKKQLRLLKQ